MEIEKQRNAPRAEPSIFDAAAGADVFVPVYRDRAVASAPAAVLTPMISAKAGMALALLRKDGPLAEDAWRGAIAGQLTASRESKAQRQAFYRVRDELKAVRAAIQDETGSWMVAE